MNVRYTETALREVDEILSHIAADNPLAADEVAAVLQTTVRRLSGAISIWTNWMGCAADGGMAAGTSRDMSALRLAPPAPEMSGGGAQDGT